MQQYTVSFDEKHAIGGRENLQNHEDVEITSDLNDLTFNSCQVRTTLSVDELQSIQGVYAANKECDIEFGNE